MQNLQSNIKNHTQLKQRMINDFKIGFKDT